MSAIPVTTTRAVRADRLRDLGIAAVLIAWLLYTRMFWVLQAAHIAAPVCPFFYFTGHPCPFCGGTRSFAYMWRGDLADAVRLYPLGPALFAGTLAAVGGLLTGAATGRTLRPQLSVEQWKGIGAGVAVTVGISWALKVFVLGN